jgi:ribosome maturation factor RimP
MVAVRTQRSQGGRSEGATVSATERQLEAVRAAIEPAVDALDCGLYDVELVGRGDARTLRLTITRDQGVDLDTITAVTRAVSPIIDDTDTVDGPFLLEVSSPGIERTLRTPEHFAGARGEQVSIKFHTTTGPQRVRGTLVESDESGCVVESDSGERVVVALGDLTQARTVFEWGPAPRPGKSKGGKQRAGAKERR